MTSLSAEILLVDDTPENLRVLGDLLRVHGLTVRVAASGVMALRSIAARRPDLILLDIHMPEMDGFEVCRRLRDSPGTTDLPILFLSASDNVIDRVQAFSSGGQDFISKPFESEEVLARITTHLHLAQTRRELDLLNDHLTERVMTEGQLRGQAEAAAVDGEVRLELTLAAARMGSWEHHECGSVFRCDRRAKEILAMPGGDTLTWRSFLERLPAAERAQVVACTGDAQTAGEFFEIDCWWQIGGEAPTLSSRRIRLRGCRVPAIASAPVNDATVTAVPVGRLVGVVWCGM